jgi:hypothetical protein
MTTVLTWAGLAVGLIALVEAVVLYLMQRRTKQLDYQIVTDRELVFPGPYGEIGDLEISYKGHPVKAPRLLALKIVNSGKVEIRRDDFDHPLSIIIPKDSGLLSSEISDVSSEVTRPSLLIHGEEVEVEPLLLNPGDWIELQLLVDGPGRPQITGRIAGVHKIGDYATRLRSRRRLREISVWSGSLLLAVIVASSIVFFYRNSRVEVPNYQYAPLAKCPSSSTAAARKFGGRATYWKKGTGGTWEYAPSYAVLNRDPNAVANISIPADMLVEVWDGQSLRSRLGPVNVRHIYRATVHCGA